MMRGIGILLRFFCTFTILCGVSAQFCAGAQMPHICFLCKKRHFFGYFRFWAKAVSKAKSNVRLIDFSFLGFSFSILNYPLKVVTKFARISIRNTPKNDYFLKVIIIYLN